MSLATQVRPSSASASGAVDPLLAQPTLGTIDPVLPGGNAARAALRASTDDPELAARLVAADESALADAYTLLGLVYGPARRVLADDAMAEEVTQEVFVCPWQHPAWFDPAWGSMRSWLGVLTHRRSVDRVRAEGGGPGVRRVSRLRVR